jgi:hypothetical protein
MHTPITIQYLLLLFKLFHPYYLIINFIAFTMFRPWGVDGIVNKLFKHGHSMTIPHINTYRMATTN